MYDYPDDEVDIVGWETFVTRQWELIFAGYATRSGLRRSARRWADLLIGGGRLPAAAADELVRAAVLGRPDLAPEDASSADEIRARMLGILDAMRAECGETATGLADDVPALVDFLRAFADGEP